MIVYGIVGWKNSGKTTLVERLVAAFVSDGLSVSTIKHAHHSVDVDQPGTDSHRHRAAGASEVMLASENRWALMHEHRGDPEPGLESLLTKLTPVDVVLVEGFKAHAHHKVEAHRNAIGAPLLAATDPAIRAIASDTPLPNLDLPIFHLDDTAAIARFILSAPHCTPAFRRDSAR